MDLGSRNGIRVNGRQVAEAPLGAQDVLRLGGWVGVVTAAVTSPLSDAGLMQGARWLGFRGHLKSLAMASEVDGGRSVAP